MARFEQLISHRFRGFDDHENSLAGLRAALDFGVRQIEFDIRVTACGTPVITHDETARDAAGRPHLLRDVRAAAFEDLGGDFAIIPTADALFQAIAAHDHRDCRILVDIKDAGFEDMIYALAAMHGLRARTLWVSWLPEVLYGLHDIDPDAPLCLSHWCRAPSIATRALHTVYEAHLGHIDRPDRRVVHGERSGWFVDGPLRGRLRQMVSWVCVPAHQISAALVDDYRADGTQVSAFSYLSKAAIEDAEAKFGHAAFFCDSNEPFTAYR